MDWTVNSSPIYIYKKKIKQNKTFKLNRNRHIKNRLRVFFPSLNYFVFYFYPCSLLLSLKIDDCTKINGHKQITHIMRDLQVPLVLSLSLSGTNHNCNKNTLQLL